MEPLRILSLEGGDFNRQASPKETAKDIYGRIENPELFAEWSGWARLEKDGVDMSELAAATSWDIAERLELKSQGRFARWLPHAIKYLFAGHWETALENLKDQFEIDEL